MECDCKGQIYDINEHNITVDIPQDAITEGKIIKLEIGVAINGPFKFPENTRPISPILCLEFFGESTESGVQKPLLITLPHCISGLTREIFELLQVKVVKCDQELGKVEEEFTQWQQVSLNFSRGEQLANGILEIKCYRSGIFCILMTGNSANYLKHCLAQVNIPPSPPIHEFHFYGLLDLASHKRVRAKKIHIKGY